eukprot:scaffold25153_cov17-Tisochrysis_lutea.AAC.1
MTFRPLPQLTPLQASARCWPPACARAVPAAAVAAPAAATAQLLQLPAVAGAHGLPMPAAGLAKNSLKAIARLRNRPMLAVQT